jgi:hypothetical protein
LAEEERAGPGVPYWSAHTSPIRLAQKMWNRAVGMQAQMRLSNIAWPQLAGPDMADIAAFVRTVNKIAEGKVFQVGDQRRRDGSCS